MNTEEVIKILEHAEGYVGIHYINGVEDPYINPCLLKAIDFAISALRAQQEREGPKLTNPCDLCAYAPPSSLDGKPCCFLTSSCERTADAEGVARDGR